MKICNECHRKLPSNNYYSYADGRLYGRCKRCSLVYFTALRRKKGIKPKHVTRTTTHRQCTACKLWKPLDQFYARKIGTAARCIKCTLAFSELRRRRMGAKPHQASNKLQLKITNTLRLRIIHALRGDTKKFKFVDLLGCSIEHFKTHLEPKFKPNMTWNNYGYLGWHVGHIKDCCSFDLTDPVQQRQCFNWANMEPQWSAYNWSKPRMLRRTTGIII